MAYAPDSQCTDYPDDIDDTAWRNITHVNGLPTVTRQTSRVNVGPGGADYDLSVNGNRAMRRAGLISAVSNVVLQTYASLDTDPTSEMCFIYGSSHAGARAHERYGRIGTDRKVRFYDQLGNQVGPDSTTLIPTAGLMHLAVEFNVLTLSTVWITLFMDGAEEMSFDTGKTPTQFFNRTHTLGSYFWWGEYLDAGVNRGVHWYTDDQAYLSSVTETDSAYNTALGIIAVYEGKNPNAGAVGTGNWPAGHWNEGVGGNDFNPVDNSELPSHDSDTTYLQTTVGSEFFLIGSSDANPLPDPFNVYGVNQRSVHRATGTDKTVGTMRHRIGGSSATNGYQATPSTSYGGNVAGGLTRPGGGAWARADYDASTLEWGMTSTTIGTAGERVTLMLGPSFVGYEDTLPLSTEPTVDVDVARRRMGQVV